MSQRIGLHELIENLRRELAYSRSKGKDRDLRFEVQDIELELQVQAERSADGSGKVDLWVFEVGGGGARKDVATQTVKLKLRPVFESDGTAPDGQPHRPKIGRGSSGEERS